MRTQFLMLVQLPIKKVIDAGIHIAVANSSSLLCGLTEIPRHY